MKTLIRLVLLLAAGSAFAHDLQFAVEAGPAVVVRLFYSDRAPYAQESYEIFRVGEARPYQVGKTDGQGRVAFVPDRPGQWRLRSMSVEGHGLDVEFATDAALAVDASERPLFDRYARPITGVAILFGFFGVFALFARRGKGVGSAVEPGGDRG